MSALFWIMDTKEHRDATGMGTAPQTLESRSSKTRWCSSPSQTRSLDSVVGLYQPRDSTTMRSSKYKTDSRVRAFSTSGSTATSDVRGLLRQVVHFATQRFQSFGRAGYTQRHISPKRAMLELDVAVWREFYHLGLLGLVVASEILLRACRPLVVLLVTPEDGGGGGIDQYEGCSARWLFPRSLPFKVTDENTDQRGVEQRMIREQEIAKSIALIEQGMNTESIEYLY
ncbi:hypothetical protein C8J56DRAFT_1031908 [Mycena floridula]|nr:hypothetical protein C8J56DRAFT_1031908 [Mycena floridula]